MRTLPVIGFFLALSFLAYGKKGGGNVAPDAPDYLPKLHGACGTAFASEYDDTSLKANNQDIGWGQTAGSDECNEPMRLVWYACQTPEGKKAIQKAGLTGFKCVGVKGQRGKLSLKSGVLVVERAYEERESYKRTHAQFREIIGMKPKLKEEDPYQDQDWRELRSKPNPVFDTKTYCVVNDKKIEFETDPQSPFIHQKDNAKIKCFKDGVAWIDLVIKEGKATGFTHYARDNFVRLEHFKDGTPDGEEVVSEDGKVKSLTYRENNTIVWTKDLHPNGKLASYSRHFPKNIDTLARDADGNVTSLSCSPHSGEDKILAPVCGFSGPSTVAVFDSHGKVQATYVYRKGVLEKQTRGDSEYAVGTDVDFKDGQKHGTEKIKNPKGLVTGIVSWKDGQQDGEEKKFDPESGKLLEQRLWAKGVLKERTEFYLNGQPKEREVYADEANHLREQFGDDGKRYFTGTYKKCQKNRYQKWCSEGTHRHYFGNGRVSNETVYKDDVAVSEKSWNENGELLRDRLLEKDGSTKEDRLKTVKKPGQST